MNDEVKTTQEKISTEDKMSTKVAEAEFNRFAELWDIDTDESSMGEDDVESYEKAKRPLIRGFKAGWLTCDEEGALTFQLRFSKKSDIKSITLDLSRADVLTMDKYKEKQSMHKLQAYMATLAGIPNNKLANIDSRDQKVMRGPILLFLGS